MHPLALSLSLFRSVALALTHYLAVFGFVLWAIFPFPPLNVFCVFLFLLVIGFPMNKNKKLGEEEKGKPLTTQSRKQQERV